MGLLERALNDGPGTKASGLMRRAEIAADAQKKKSARIERKPDAVDAAVQPPPEVEETSDYLFPFMAFEKLRSSWPVVRSALLFKDSITSAVAPWMSDGLDETSSRRLRLPSAFAERTFCLPVSIFENSGLELFKPYFSEQDFRTLRRLSFIKTSRGSAFFMVAETHSSTALDLGAIARYAESVSERVERSRSTFSLRRLADSAERLDAAFASFKNREGTPGLFLLSSEAMCDAVVARSPSIDMYRLHLDIASLAGTAIGSEGAVLSVRMPQFALLLLPSVDVDVDLVLNQLNCQIRSALGIGGNATLTIERRIPMEKETPSVALRPYL